jgi:hypothetical protein
MLMVRLSLAVVWAHQGVWCKWMGRDRRPGAVADAAGMVLQNAAFLMLAWMAAGVIHGL